MSIVIAFITGLIAGSFTTVFSLALIGADKEADNED